MKTSNARRLTNEISSVSNYQREKYVKISRDREKSFVLSRTEKRS